MRRTSARSKDDDFLVVESRPMIKLIEPVPYRVAQKQQSPYAAMLVRACDVSVDPLAPNVLSIVNGFTTFEGKEVFPDNDAIKSLQIADEIFVMVYQSATEIVSRDYSVFNEFTFHHASVVLSASGIAKTVFIGDRTKKTSELAFISNVICPKDDENNVDCEVYLSDTTTFTEYKVPTARFSQMRRSKVKPGTLIRVHHLHFAGGTRVTPSHDLVLHPDCATIQNLEMKTLPCEYRDTTCVEYVMEPDPLEYPQQIMASVALLECLYKRDVQQSILPCKLSWKFTDSNDAQVSYFAHHPIETGGNTKKNYKNSLFRKGTIAILRMCNGRGISYSPAHVRVVSAVYKEDFTRISFQVDPNYLLRMWSMGTYNELASGNFSLEPTNLLWYLVDFTKKVAENPNYIDTRMDSRDSQRLMIEPLLPTKSKIIRKRVSNEEQPSSSSAFGSLSVKQSEAINAIVCGKPVVVIDGAARTGKTEIAMFAVSRLLKEKLGENDCLFLTSTACLIENTYKIISRSVLFNDARESGNVRILNLLGLQYVDPLVNDSLNAVVSLLLRDRRLPMEDLQVLKDSRNVLDSKLAAEYQNVFGDMGQGNADTMDELEWELDGMTLGLGDVAADVKDIKKNIRSKTASQFITSAELEALQNILVIIFKHYKPNLVIVDRLTMISVLPVIRGLITHLFIDCAGNVPLMDAIAIATESSNLEQLIISGDSTQCPTHRRIRLDKLPKFFQSTMSGINNFAEQVTRIQLNKTFCLNAGITRIMQDVMYETQNLQAVSKKKSITTFIKNPEYPIMFLEMRGQDNIVFPTTRTNSIQSKLACFLAGDILNKEKNVTLAILCYYVAQADEIRKSFGRKLPTNLIVSTVDSFSQERADVTIIVTTRTVNGVKPEYHQCLVRGERYLKRVIVPHEEIRKVLCLENYWFVFDRQRLAAAISRAERTCFIIGNSELLRENERWCNLIETIHEYGNYVAEPAFLPEHNQFYNVVGEYTPEDEDFDKRPVPECIELSEDEMEDVVPIKFIKRSRFQRIINY